MSAFEVCYCFPRGDENLSMAYRFLTTYLLYPPAIQHDTVILTDPGNEQNAEDFFATLPNLRVEATPDHAKDLSRYEAHAQRSTAECMMMLGGSTYLRRPGWGLRALTAFQRLGSNAIFGSCGHAGVPTVHKHVRTTGWWAAPSLLRQYPGWPKSLAGRYEAEHGKSCISAWVLARGGQCWIINFGSEFTLENPQGDANGYAKGNHSNLLIGDRLTMPPFMPFA